MSWLNPMITLRDAVLGLIEAQKASGRQLEEVSAALRDSHKLLHILIEEQQAARKVQEQNILELVEREIEKRNLITQDTLITYMDTKMDELRFQGFLNRKE